MAFHNVSQNSGGQNNGAAVLGASGASGLGHQGLRASAQQPADRHLLSLVRAVEGEIVPRLLLARRSPAPVTMAASGAQIHAADVEQLARLLLAEDIEAPYAHVDAIRERGVGERDIYLRVLAPAARRLGILWDRDECDFLQVALGLGRLHQLLQRISLQTAGPQSLESRGNGRRALLATVPGEGHCFGVMMVSQFFRQNGWDVFNEFPDSEHHLARCVRAESFAIVGLSAGTESRLEAMAAAVRTVRRNSRNAGVGIIVGGLPFQSHPEWARRVGADATAEDGEQAARLGESVCALLAGER
jgi:methanogenic corrinoid protein MtbC1